jgi:hypothetical protein
MLNLCANMYWRLQLPGSFPKLLVELLLQLLEAAAAALQAVSATAAMVAMPKLQCRICGC